MDSEPDPEQLRSFPTVELLMQWASEAQNEVASKAWDRRGRWPRPALAVFTIQIRAHAIEYPQRLEEYEEKEKEFDKLYGNPVQRGYVLAHEEADKRLRNALFLTHDIGPLMIDTKYAYYAERSPDTIDFSGWSDD